MGIFYELFLIATIAVLVSLSGIMYFDIKEDIDKLTNLVAEERTIVVTNEEK